MIVSELNRLREYYTTGATRSYAFRKQQLEALKNALLRYEEEINAALLADLDKPPVECWVTEMGMVLHEIDFMLKNLRRLMRPEAVGTNLINFPSESKIIPEPLGVVLIIAPWNYPVNLLLAPLVGAIAAGNCVVLKPSELAPHVATVMEKIIRETYSPHYIRLLQGEGETLIPEMLNSFRFDHIFFTGSRRVGQEIMRQSAAKLVPVTLELGGKSPCIVEADADIATAAKRIIVAKLVNAGQTCVAPDYVLVDESIKEKFLAAAVTCIKDFYGVEPLTNPEFGKIINEKHFNRVSGYLTQGQLVYGGQTDPQRLRIEPTLLTNIPDGSSILAEEIFGPVLPVISFKTHDEAVEIIKRNPYPLAFYVFTRDAEKEKQWIQEIPFGGGCVNNAGWHLLNPKLPFGGVGYSGMGSYHGPKSFERFSHYKPILKTPTWFDPRMKYPPYRNKLSLFKRLFG